MTKYELSLTKNYVPDWDVTDAIRELFQNALDQETVAPDNKMFWGYGDGVFRVGNKMSILEPKSLLLGATTKADNDATIGKFGEGYKIATLVLTRLGKTVTFYNYGAREVWRARFSKSRKYNAEILVIEVDKKFPWTTVPDNNLTIEIEGVTAQDFEQICSTNLHITDDVGKTLYTPQGRVLMRPDLKGKMFVNGLYICTADKFHYGYDFKPDKIRLDRDRKLVSDFNLSWTTSQMWLSSQDVGVVGIAAELVSVNAPDTAYVTDVYFYGDNKMKGLSEKVTESFVTQYGSKAVPVTTQKEAELVPKTHKPIIVTETVSKVISSNKAFIKPEPVHVPTLSDEVEGWLDKWYRNINSKARKELQAILREEKELTKAEDEDLPF